MSLRAKSDGIVWSSRAPKPQSDEPPSISSLTGFFPASLALGAGGCQVARSPSGPMTIVSPWNGFGRK